MVDFGFFRMQFPVLEHAYGDSENRKDWRRLWMGMLLISPWGHRNDALMPF